MADPRFFTRAGPFTLAELAALSESEIWPGGDPSASYQDVASLDQADSTCVSFLDNRKYADAFASSRAGACVVKAEMVPRAPAGMALLVSKDPYRSYALIARAFYPVPAPEPWIAPTAWIHETASVGEGCRIEPGAVVGSGAEIGPRCHIGPNAVIGDGVILGGDCTVGACASISHSVIGSRVYIYPGARIGQDGFGFAMGPRGHLRVPQLGRVIIGDDVEIGANTTIDRGAGPDTIIGSGCMIDNLVQIGHNVQLGRGCVIVAQVGISGSTRFGDFVVAAGQAGFAGHLKIGSGAQIAAQGGVLRDIGPGEKVGGTPAVPLQDWMRQSVTMSRLIKKRD